MYEQWRDIEEFTDYYQVSNYGRIFSEYHSKVLKPYAIQSGLATVGLVKDGIQYRRSIPLLVAKAWLPPSEEPHFNTPIQLDGDRWNCSVDNLVWRPRWLALAFRREHNINPFPDWEAPILIPETGEVFASPLECSKAYGVLQRDVWRSIINAKPVFPQMYHYRFAHDERY